MQTEDQKPQEAGQPMVAMNGLTADQTDAIHDLIIGINRLSMEIEGLGRHRSYSLAVTKLDEARHWLSDRFYRAA